MPLFFLNVEYNDGSALADEEGAEFLDAAVALQEARRALKELVCENYLS